MHEFTYRYFDDGLSQDWSSCITRKRNQAKAKPYKLIFDSFFRRSNSDLAEGFLFLFPFLYLSLLSLPLESVRAAADERTLASKANFLASMAMEASLGQKFRYIHLLHSAYSFTYNFYFDFYSCLLPCFLCPSSNEDFSVSTNYLRSCIVTDIR